MAEISEIWESFWGKFTDEELDKLALLRVMECTNGCIQHAYRDKSPVALSTGNTKMAMNFSMGSIKKRRIDLSKDVVIEFEDELAEAVTRTRNLYILAFKENNENARKEYFECSGSSIRAIGLERLEKAAALLFKYQGDTFPLQTIQWGLRYLFEFLPSTEEEEELTEEIVNEPV